MQEYYRRRGFFKKYLITDKKRFEQISNLYNSNKKYFGKTILDIACGGGVLGFLVEKDEKNYLGVDINKDMINSAKKYAEKINSKNKFLLKDVTISKVPGKFDTFTFIGNGLSHLTTHDFLKLLCLIKNNAKKNSYFVVDYRDVVDLFYKRKWRNKETKGVDLKKGEINLTSLDSDKKKINFSHSIWSPFIIESLMESQGWKLIKRTNSIVWQGYFEIYQKRT